MPSDPLNDQIHNNMKLRDALKIARARGFKVSVKRRTDEVVIKHPTLWDPRAPDGIQQRLQAMQTDRKNAASLLVKTLQIAQEQLQNAD